MDCLIIGCGLSGLVMARTLAELEEKSTSLSGGTTSVEYI